MYTVLTELGEIEFYSASVTPSLYALGKCALGQVRLKFKRFMSMDNRPEEYGWVLLESVTMPSGEVRILNKLCAIY